MLFNSYEFIFAFLPLTLAGFYVLGAAASRQWALRWIILVSFVFYAWWRPFNVILIAPSIAINFALARLLQRLGADEGRRGFSRAVLFAGIGFNIAFLGYFKYTNFLIDSVNDVFGTNFVLARIILPLGVSFITFQKIAFLVDVQAGRVKSFTFQDYCLFVLFFPQLIAGPIVHYREMMPQFHAAPCRFDKEDVSVGLTLFFTGLFKKAFLADSIAPLVTDLFGKTAAGGNPSLLISWMAAIGFTLQIYFDFSGYTDMALGLGRLFGVRLPPNFNSPLRASSIIDFWLRWHMTLTRFLTAYIYNPLVLWLARRRAASGLPGFGGRNTTLGAFVQLLVLPTLLTMFVSGVWHGAGYLFILWGLLHGVYLTINHGWRLIAPRLWPNRRSYARIMEPGGVVLTFLSVVVAMVLFRSSTVASAVRMLKGMVGLNGVSLPQPVDERLGALAPWLKSMGVAADPVSGQNFVFLLFWLVVLLVIAFACPNTLQVLAAYEPALGVKRRLGDRGLIGKALEWTPSLAWAVGASVVAAIGVLSLTGQSEFLYWQF
jgi:alginate O-acetyltransferase complex protein AlgI